MQATFARTYNKKETQNDVFVYAMTFANDAEHDVFKTAQGKNYRVDKVTGDVLWFSPRYHGEIINLIVTSNNKIVADTAAFAKAKSLAKQYGGDFGAELAKASAQSLIAGMLKPASAQAAQSPEPTELPS